MTGSSPLMKSGVRALYLGQQLRSSLSHQVLEFELTGTSAASSDAKLRGHQNELATKESEPPNRFVERLQLLGGERYERA